MSDLEPALPWDDIQGNIAGGFNKDYQALLGYRFGADPTKTKSFVRALASQTTSLREVMQTKSALRAGLLAESREPALRDAWTCVSFSFPGLLALTPEAGAFTSNEFRGGLSASSARLGDPIDPGSPGFKGNWKVGGSVTSTPDCFVIAAADRGDDLQSLMSRIDAFAEDGGATRIYGEIGRDPSTYSTDPQQFSHGHEHFGFKDGISQPGIRGTLPDGTLLTAGRDPSGTGIEYAAPGQPLLCAGEFLLGYATQDDDRPRVAGPPDRLGPKPFAPDPAAVAPWWARNGSFLVFRRLRQDVAAFRDFVSRAASMVPAGVGAERVAALCVGRWPSGASLMRAPLADDATQATKALANAFAYTGLAPSLGLTADPNGVTCPVTAHLRKVNPRDDGTDQGGDTRTLVHRIIRRGIPFGPPYDLEGQQGEERGLFFLAFQRSIADQFEFISHQWMNNTRAPENPGAHPSGIGFDMLVGQNQVDRSRFAFLRFSNTPPFDEHRIDNGLDVKDWVVPTGGGYFFTPSISALRDVLGA